MPKFFRLILWCIITFFLAACEEGEERLYQLLSPQDSGIDFKNSIVASDSFNLLDFEYLYNGGGVGVGDFNQDGRPDLVFTGNQVPSEIYLNQGDLQFISAGREMNFTTKGTWATGVTVVDINNDGWDDIYVCVGGPGNVSEHPNLLFINEAGKSFLEAGAEYGINDPNESTQALFFDYDLDGDLDMYLLNGGGFERSAVTVRPRMLESQNRNTDRLYQNTGLSPDGHPLFKDVSADAGIAIEGFGLGAAALDVNHDGYPDIYVSNDYLSKDIFYLNQGDGTFEDATDEYFDHLSHFSMGSVAGDVNNDGQWDLLTLDMLPASHLRRKLMFGPNTRDKVERATQYGYGNQYMRNMLQLGSARSGFREIGQYAGVAKSDWSWCPLLGDLDNDGYQDYYITNGYGKDITDLDYVKFRKSATQPFGSPEEAEAALRGSLADQPAIKTPNFCFRNAGGSTFVSIAEKWGLAQSSLSNGAVLVDLDQDGDLEIVTNNIDQPAFVYESRLRQQRPDSSNFLRVNLTGPAGNRGAFGATVRVYSRGTNQTRYQQPSRGFQSSGWRQLHFGLGTVSTVDSITVTWPDGQVSRRSHPPVNEAVTIPYREAVTPVAPNRETTSPLLANYRCPLPGPEKEPIRPDEFKRQALLLYGAGSQGPGLAVGDIDNDGREDLFVGGPYGVPATLHRQDVEGCFTSTTMPSEQFEDLGAVLFDADNDGDEDLYVCSGGTERYANHDNYQDRLYRNDGTGTFTDDPDALPVMKASTSTVAAGDFNGDGQTDLFVGGRITPQKFPTPPRSYLLANRQGRFVDVTDEICPALRQVGMVTSALWTDFNNDKLMDLIVVGHMMPISVFQNDGHQLKAVTGQLGLAATTGLWNSIIGADLNQDGSTDYVIGNIGKNLPFELSATHPLHLHYADFDANGSVDPIYSVWEEGNYYPLASLDDLATQLPGVKKVFLKYHDYAQATTQDLLNELGNEKVSSLTAHYAASIALHNDGLGNFTIKELPAEAQYAPVKGIVGRDVNYDGLPDLVLCGNEEDTETVYGHMDSGRGTILLNQGDFEFATPPGTPDIGLRGSYGAAGTLHSVTGKQVLLFAKTEGEVRCMETSEVTQLSTITFKSGEWFANLTYDDAALGKIEHYAGGGYLSQQSSTFAISTNVRKVTMYGTNGRQTRAWVPKPIIASK